MANSSIGTMLALGGVGVAAYLLYENWGTLFPTASAASPGAGAAPAHPAATLNAAQLAAQASELAARNRRIANPTGYGTPRYPGLGAANLAPSCPPGRVLVPADQQAEGGAYAYVGPTGQTSLCEQPEFDPNACRIAGGHWDASSNSCSGVPTSRSMMKGQPGHVAWWAAAIPFDSQCPCQAYECGQNGGWWMTDLKQCIFPGSKPVYGATPDQIASAEEACQSQNTSYEQAPFIGVNTCTDPCWHDPTAAQQAVITTNATQAAQNILRSLPPGATPPPGVVAAAGGGTPAVDLSVGAQQDAAAAAWWAAHPNATGGIDTSSQTIQPTVQAIQAVAPPPSGAQPGPGQYITTIPPTITSSGSIAPSGGYNPGGGSGQHLRFRHFHRGAAGLDASTNFIPAYLLAPSELPADGYFSPGASHIPAHLIHGRGY